MSVIVLIIIKRWTKYFLVTSANFDAKLDSVPDPKRDKIAWLVFGDTVVYVIGVFGICHRNGLTSSTQNMPLYAEKCQRSGLKKYENVNGLDKKFNL